jgi:phosphonate transport system substrate-binding protein
MSTSADRPATSGTSLPRLALLTLGLVAVAAAAYGVVYVRNQPPPPVDTAAALKTYLAEQDKYLRLAAGYADADGDLVADAPADPAKLLRPDEITFSVVATDDPAKAAETWKPFLAHLQQATGVKAVVYYPGFAAAKPDPATPAPKGEDDPGPPPPGGTVEQQLDALKAGKLHVTAFNTGFVPAAVNTAGFVPLFCPADTEGKSTIEMEVIVPAGSSAKSPADLKGQKLAFVAMSSNTGGKAPLVLLKQQFNMLPGRDYDFVVSGSHERSVEGVAGGKYAAASVAGDILKRHPDAGKVKSIYASNPFPPLTFGVPYNLDPKLRAAVEKAFETFAFEGTSVGKYYAAAKQAKFVRVDYKKDFAFVREIDEKLAKLADAK